ncbi:MAG: ABC transporter substrate-binding protein [Alphaproteobacteria bacterium]|nr:ABC transporter substrate-binding protein [Alphaproteobacteria bacterium]MCW5743347.1 ABC transporter substrate-binding protein [Alphaproteobacteria bacterium]
MQRRVLLATTIALASTPVLAQSAAGPRRIGVLIDGAAPHPLPDALRASFKRLGYVEGHTIAFDVRYANGQPSLAAEHAAELVRSRVSLIMAHFTPAVRAAMAATTTIPIIMAPAGAPVETGIVKSLSRPGGNVTGVTNMAAELGGRRLQLLRDMIPGLRRVAVLASSQDPFTKPFLSYMETAAKSGGIALDPAMAAGPADFDAAFEEFAAGKADAVVIQGVFNSNHVAILALAGRHRLPTMWFDRRAVQAGGLVSLSANTTDIYHRAAVMADSVLRGARPGDLPVEQPAVFELLVNQKTAKALGLTIPELVLMQADEVFE